MTIAESLPKRLSLHTESVNQRLQHTHTAIADSSAPQPHDKLPVTTMIGISY